MAEARRIARATFLGRLSGAATTWAVAAALAFVYVLSTIPTPLYADYRHAFGFSPLMLTFIYAAYTIGTFAAIFLGGRLSDQVGRRSVVLAAIGIAAVAVALFLLARGTPWLFAAPQIAIAANLIGLGVGPLLAGLLAEYAPAPLRLAYVVMVPMLVVAFVAVWLGRETRLDRKALREASLRPRIGVPGPIRPQFLVAAVGAFATFAVMGFYAALLPSVLQHALHETSHAIAGAIAGGMFLIAAVTVALAKLEPARGLIAGLVLLILGVGVMIPAEHARSMALLLAATGIVGVASGLGYLFSLELLNEAAPDDRRAEIISAYLIVCYVAIALPVIGVGIVSAVSRPIVADAIFAALVALLAVVALAIEITLRRGRRRVRPPSTE